MAELLIKAINARHKDADKDRRGTYKRGDPVLIQRDGWHWGRLETIPRFWRVRIPGVERHFCDQFVMPEFTTELIWFRHQEFKPHIRSRRRWHFAAEMLSPQKRLALYRGEIVDLTWNEFLNAMYDKKGIGGRKSLILEVAA